MQTRHYNPWLVLVIVGLAQFMVILDATIVNVARRRFSTVSTSLSKASSGSSTRTR